MHAAIKNETTNTKKKPRIGYLGLKGGEGGLELLALFSRENLAHLCLSRKGVHVSLKNETALWWSSSLSASSSFLPRTFAFARDNITGTESNTPKANLVSFRYLARGGRGVGGWGG